MIDDPVARLTQWARIWSPLASSEERLAAWEALGIDGEGPPDDFWSLFHNGAPSPQVPLLFHAALGIPGDSAREDWMRSLDYLGLEWKDNVLPPDHLAVACDVVAYAAAEGETVLVRELTDRYLMRWAASAGEKLADCRSVCADLPARFTRDVDDLTMR
jgi:hypothetical protein